MMVDQKRIAELQAEYRALSDEVRATNDRCIHDRLQRREIEIVEELKRHGAEPITC